MDLSLSLYLVGNSDNALNGSTLAELVMILGERGLLGSKLTVSLRGSKGFSIRSHSELGSHASSWGDGAFVRLSSPARDFEGTFALVGGRRCDIDLYFFSLFLGGWADSLLPSITAAVNETMARIAGLANVSRHSGLSVRNLTYPRLRPACRPLVVDQGMLLDIIDQRIEVSPEEQQAINVLRNAPLPEGVERGEVESIIIINWAKGHNLDQIEAIRRQLAIREEWLARNSGSTIEPDWNAMGDVRHYLIGGQPHRRLTLYSPSLGVGYKAIHGSMPTGEIEPTLRQVGEWIRSRRVDNETEVSDVIIITDSRQSAITLYPRMIAIGVRHVVYGDDEGNLWDPFPEGEWNSIG